MDSNAQAFLRKVLPWPATPEAGKPPYLNIHWKRLLPDGKTFWDGRPNATVAEMAKNVVFYCKGPEPTDMYFCLSSQRLAEKKVSKRNKVYYKASRFTAHAIELKSLFIDIDVKADKPDKAYATSADAIAGLKNFVDTLGFPMPTAVVASGTGGMHVYWSFKAPLALADWQPLAHALVRACASTGLKTDPQCTIDAARILRVPGTLNHKTSPPSPVKLLSLGQEVDLEAVKSVLEAFGLNDAIPTAGAGPFELPTQVTVNPGLVGSDHNSELTGGIETGYAPVSVEAVAKNCAFVAEALQTGGAGFDNNLWFLSTCVASYVGDPRATAHQMASGHPGYTYDSTDAQYERVLRTRSGWPSCEKIDLGGYAGCKTCPLRPLNKSPLNHSIDPDAPAPELPAEEAAPIEGDPEADTPLLLSALPNGFFYDPSGVIIRRYFDGEGKTLSAPVLSYPMLNAWLQDNPWVLHFTTFIHGGRRTKVEAPLAELAAKDGVTKVFARQGMLVPEKAGATLREFLVSWIKQLQESKDAVVSSTPFGWAVTHGKIEGFTYAGKVWRPDGSRPASAPDPVLSSHYTPRGDLEPWLDAAKIITDQERPALDAILAASFGAPLVRFTGHPGVMLSAYSPESGIGKTTTMRVSQAVWGDPVKSLQTLNDTANSVLKKLGSIKALPLFWDELKTEQDTSRFALMAFQLTQGVEKARLNSDVTQKERGTWETMLISASNDSLIDPITKATKGSVAGIFRLFEYTVKPGEKGQVEHGIVSRSVARLNENFGHAGLMYAKFLGANSARVEREVGEIQDALAKKTKAANDERLWIATITCVLAGAKYANELGLTNINVRTLKLFLLEVMAGMRVQISDAPNDMKNTMSVSNILAQFLNAMQARHTLYTNKIHNQPGKPAKGAIKVLRGTDKLEGVYVQIGLEDSMMRISSTYLGKWLADNDYPRHVFTKAMKDEFGVKIINGKLGSGTDRSNPMEYLLEIDMAHPTLSGFID